MRRKISAIIVTVLMGAAAGLTTASPAQAAGVRMNAYSQYNYAFWQPDGDLLSICDGVKDGLSVLVQAWWGAGTASPRLPDKWHTAGGGNAYANPPSYKCTDRSYGNVEENHWITFRVCLGDASENTYREWLCGDYYVTKT
jgi:hypothetical protein